jgi:hypothetical protein
MSIERTYGEITIVCDGCGDGIDTLETDFDQALTSAKAVGWVPRKVDGEWKHYCCPGCEKSEAVNGR